MSRTTRLLTLTASAAVVLGSIAGPARALTPPDVEPELAVPLDPCVVAEHLPECAPDDGPAVEPTPDLELHPCTWVPALCDGPGLPGGPELAPNPDPDPDPGPEPDPEPGAEPGGQIPTAEPAGAVHASPTFTG